IVRFTSLRPMRPYLPVLVCAVRCCLAMPIRRACAPIVSQLGSVSSVLPRLAPVDQRLATPGPCVSRHAWLLCALIAAQSGAVFCAGTLSPSTHHASCRSHRSAYDGQEGATYQSAMFHVFAPFSGHFLKLQSVGLVRETSATMNTGS